jgi:triosephosphate isomerase (TIM)
MPRTPIVAGNWKMNTNLESARALATGIKSANLEAIAGVEKVICPPFVYLPAIAQIVAGTSIRVGAQDVHWEEKGAFTGEVSTGMLKDFVSHVIIGHSERRAMFGDTDEAVAKKLAAVIAAGLTPILCVGETGAERQAGQTQDVLRRQVESALRDVDFPPTGVIAYEPVWAIGTGVAATAQDANDAIAFIRHQVAASENEATADAVRILYGGSVSPANIAELVDQPQVDGGLVGGASLDANSFAAMVQAIA